MCSFRGDSIDQSPNSRNVKSFAYLWRIALLLPRARGEQCQQRGEYDEESIHRYLCEHNRSLDSKDSRFSAMYKMRGSRLSIVLSGNNLFEEKEIRLFSWIFIHELSLVLFLLYLSIKYYFFAWKIIYKIIVTNLCVRLLWYFIFTRYTGWIFVHIYILILCISPREKH